jgi:hypothetical protein
MSSIIDEAGARVKEEMENMKQQYNKNLEILLCDMKRIEDVGNYILLYVALTKLQERLRTPFLPTQFSFSW